MGAFFCKPNRDHHVWAKGSNYPYTTLRAICDMIEVMKVSMVILVLPVSFWANDCCFEDRLVNRSSCLAP